MRQAFTVVQGSKSDASVWALIWDDFRIFRQVLGLFLVLGIVCLSQALWASSLDERTLMILTQGFSQQNPKAQRQILRQIGLMGSHQSVSFLFEVALNDQLNVDSRFDALKALLAIDATRYKPILPVLSSVSLDQDQLLIAMEQIRDPRFVSSLFLHLKLENKSRAHRMMSLALGLWSPEDREHYDFSSIHTQEGNEWICTLLESSNEKKKIPLIYIAGKIRNAETHKILIQFLESTNEEWFEAALQSLSQGSHDASSAIGRALIKERNSKRKMSLIKTLSTINSPSSRRALQAYVSHANFDEKHLIEKILESKNQ